MAKTDSGIGLPTGIFDDPFNCAGFDFSVALDVTNEKGRLAKGIYNARHPVRFIPNQSSSLTGKKVWSFEIGESIISSPAVAQGMVVIGCDNGSWMHGFWWG